jgi:hypothetical protein
MIRTIYANYFFPLEEARSKEELEAEKASKAEEKEAFAIRVSKLPNDPAILDESLEVCGNLLESEKSRRESVEARLTTMMGLASIAGSIVFGSILALATGTLRAPSASLRWFIVIVAVYLTVQIASGTLAAVRGLSRRGYLSERGSEVLPFNEERDAYFRRRIACTFTILLDHRDQNNRKVTQMAVAHQALTNFVWGLLLLALLGGVYGIRVRPSDDLVETLKKNHELQEMLRGPQGQPGIAGPRGEPGPVGPKGDPSR